MQIPYTLLKNLHSAGIILDKFGNELKQGDTVLCKGYGTSGMNSLSKILKVNKKTITVEVHYRTWNMGQWHPRPEGHTGYWNSYPDRHIITASKLMKRNPYEVIKMPDNAIEQLQTRESELTDLYPELLI